ncbi:glutathione ABC transporter ATP-binding protein [Devosia geojensis]|uniref:Glutathione import ATP-binding protein GsiA n=1 Tax=Devosia geojensis TaxID=443610 RepID=A0A0F5FFC2_9HYPH|nr:ABC transporter ATP-binding protein [Devosia geojensis]KKB06892.1 glutathione ABC transporter ATP-binding protein [Devosia geojensis]
MVVPVLSVAGLKTSFRNRGQWTSVVHGIDFTVGKRETVALVGESGSGKSVTAMSVMQLLDPKLTRIEGSIRLEGEELLGLTDQRMNAVRGKRIGMIFQEPMTSLNPVMPIGEQIAEAILAHKAISHAEARAEAIRQLDRVRIPDAAARYAEHAHQFSGGMRQRVMIAMALACGPKLLIADEPTTALDVTIQAQIIELIKSLQDEEDMSVLFITHDMGVVAEIADRTVVMRHGRLVEEGATVEIFAHPRQPYTKALLSAVPKLGSMAGEPRPRRFAIADPETGVLGEPAASLDTVDHEGPPVLEVNNLVTRFAIKSGLLGRVKGRVHAVENVSLSLKRGETLSIVGESGCGKSTTGLSILQLISPLSGSVRLDGEEVTGLSEEAMRARRKRMQMIFQDPFASLNPRMTVGAAIAEPMLLHAMARPAEVPDRVAALLERVGLSPAMANRYPHQLSGGQRQRICIARALAVEPSVIVADESVSALDVSIKAQVVNLLLELQESLRLSYLFISHDMAVVERVSHRVAVMYLGEIVEIGSRADIFSNPQHPYTRKLLAAVPVADPAQRNRRRAVGNEDVRSPVRPADYVPPPREYRQVSSGHLVMA